MAERDIKRKFQTILHGNSNFKAIQLLKNSQAIFETDDTKIEFLPSPDLDVFKKYADMQLHPDTLSLIDNSKPSVAGISAILVLISLTSIFSEEMRNVIVGLPYHECYGFDENNANEWWAKVIVVFSFGENERGGESQVKDSISGNKGIREITGKAGGLYIWVSDSTTLEELTNKLENFLTFLNKKFKDYSVGYQEMDESFQKYLKGVPDRSKETHQTFILLGKNNSGKSTLGNLLAGPREKQIFKTHPYHERKGLTKKLQIGDITIDPILLFGEGIQPNKMLKLRIVDLPGFDDSSISLKKYGELLAECIKETNKTLYVTFLILIDLNSEYFSLKDFLKIRDTATLLANGMERMELNERKPGKVKYDKNFYTKTKIIFTHAEMLDWRLDEGILNLRLLEMLKEEKYSHLKDLVDLFDQRYTFINGANSSEINRNWLLKKLWRSHKVTDVSLQSNKWKKFERMNLEENILFALKKLCKNTMEISSMFLLINLEEHFNEELYNLILTLPQTHNLGGAKEFILQYAWEHIFTIFKVPAGGEDYIEQRIGSDQLLKELVGKIKNKYTLVTEKNSSDECYQKLIELISKTKSEGNIVSLTFYKTQTASIDKQNSRGLIVDKSPAGIEQAHGNESTDSNVAVSRHKIFGDNDSILTYFIKTKTENKNGPRKRSQSE